MPLTDPNAGFVGVIPQTAEPRRDAASLAGSEGAGATRANDRRAVVVPQTDRTDRVYCGPVPISHVCDWPLRWTS